MISMRVVNEGGFSQQHVSMIYGMANNAASTLGLYVDRLHLTLPKDVRIIMDSTGEQLSSYQRTGIGQLQVDYDSGIVYMSTTHDFLRRTSKNTMRRLVEHEMCHCKDYADGLYGRDMKVYTNRQAMKEFPMHLAYFFEIFMAYTDYRVSQRQIKVFGGEGYRVYHLYGLNEFLQEMEKEAARGIMNRDESQIRQVFFTCLKEYIKSRLCGYRIKGMRNAVFQVADLTKGCFDDISAAPIIWDEAGKLLNFVVFDLILKIDLPATYLSDVVQPNNEHGSVGIDNKKRFLGIRDRESVRVAEGIERRFDDFLNSYANP